MGKRGSVLDFGRFWLSHRGNGVYFLKIKIFLSNLVFSRWVAFCVTQLKRDEWWKIQKILNKKEGKSKVSQGKCILFEKLDRTVYKNPMSLIHFEGISRCLAVCFVVFVWTLCWLDCFVHSAKYTFAVEHGTWGRREKTTKKASKMIRPFSPKN